MLGDVIWNSERDTKNKFFWADHAPQTKNQNLGVLHDMVPTKRKRPIMNLKNHVAMRKAEWHQDRQQLVKN